MSCHGCLVVRECYEKYPDTLKPPCAELPPTCVEGNGCVTDRVFCSKCIRKLNDVRDYYSNDSGGVATESFKLLCDKCDYKPECVWYADGQRIRVDFACEGYSATKNVS